MHTALFQGYEPRPAQVPSPRISIQLCVCLTQGPQAAPPLPLLWGDQPSHKDGSSSRALSALLMSNPSHMPRGPESTGHLFTLLSGGFSCPPLSSPVHITSHSHHSQMPSVEAFNIDLWTSHFCLYPIPQMSAYHPRKQ